MQDISSIGKQEDRIFQDMLGRYDAPAYVRRARRVQQAYDDLLAMCKHQREQWLGMVRVRLATLIGLAGEWSALRPFLSDDRQGQLLVDLHSELAPKLLGPIERTSSSRLLRRALLELCLSLERFNRRWRSFVSEVRLDQVNQERAAYNRYYVLEKECALRSAVLARQGFRPLEPLTSAEVAALLPELPVPLCASS